MNPKPTKINCIIVDDEPLSHDILKRHLAEFPFLELTATCYNAFETSEILQNSSIDLMFLDINMPKLSGLNFLKSLEKKPLVVFITAYPEFALEGFELDAIDYLLKPISFERFFKAVNKISKQFELHKPAVSQKSAEYIFIKADKRLYKVDLDDTLHIQSFGDYVRIITPQKMFVTHDTLKNIYLQLPSDKFVKVHKSYIIPLEKINFVEGNFINIQDNIIPIGATYREKTIRQMTKKKV